MLYRMYGRVLLEYYPMSLVNQNRIIFPPRPAAPAGQTMYIRYDTSTIMILVLS